jgi:hypothetical protein
MRRSQRWARRVKQYFGHQKVAIKEGVVEAAPYFTTMVAVIRREFIHALIIVF